MSLPVPPRIKFNVPDNFDIEELKSTINQNTKLNEIIGVVSKTEGEKTSQITINFKQQFVEILAQGIKYAVELLKEIIIELIRFLKRKLLGENKPLLELTNGLKTTKFEEDNEKRVLNKLKKINFKK